MLNKFIDNLSNPAKNDLIDLMNKFKHEAESKYNEEKLKKLMNQLLEYMDFNNCRVVYDIIGGYTRVELEPYVVVCMNNNWTDTLRMYLCILDEVPIQYETKDEECISKYRALAKRPHTHFNGVTETINECYYTSGANKKANDYLEYFFERKMEQYDK